MKKETMASLYLKRAKKAQEERRRRGTRLFSLQAGTGVFRTPPQPPPAMLSAPDTLPPSDNFWLRIQRHFPTPAKWLVYVPAGTILKQKDREPQEWTVLNQSFLAITAKQASSGQKEVVVCSLNHPQLPMPARTLEVSKTEVLWLRQGFTEAR